MTPGFWPRAVVFDFNGTLSDDEPILCQVFGALFRDRLGWELTDQEYYDELAGLSDREIVERAVAHCRPASADEGLVAALLAERRSRYADLVADRSPVQAGTRALVDALVASGRVTAIVTGAQRQDVELVLAGVPEGRHFEVIVTEEDVRQGKPDPEGFLCAAEALAVAPSDILVLEDSVAGVRAARAAGMKVVAVAGTRSRETLAAEGVPVIEALGPDLLDRSPFVG